MVRIRFWGMLFTVVIWFVISGQPVILYIARTTGIWFDGFAGVLLMLSIGMGVLILILRIKPRVRLPGIYVLLLFSTLSVIGITSSASFGSAYWLSKSTAFLGNTIVVAVFGLLCSNCNINVTTFGSVSLFSILLTVYWILREMRTFLGFELTRTGVGGNVIWLAYSIAFSFMFLIMMFIEKRRPFALILSVILGTVALYAYGTRQVLVMYFVFIVIITLSEVLRSELRRNPGVRSNKISRRTSPSSLRIPGVLIFITLLVGIYYVLKNFEVIAATVESTFNTATYRWQFFFEEKSLDMGRRLYNKEGLITWIRSPLTGSFAYETEGQWAHQTIIDCLSQIGLFGTLPLLIVWFFALKSALNCIVFNCRLLGLKSYMSFLLIPLTFNSLFVTTNLLYPPFIFCIFFLFSAVDKPRKARETNIDHEGSGITQKAAMKT